MIYKRIDTSKPTIYVEVEKVDDGKWSFNIWDGNHFLYAGGEFKLNCDGNDALNYIIEQYNFGSIEDFENTGIDDINSLPIIDD